MWTTGILSDGVIEWLLGFQIGWYEFGRVDESPHHSRTLFETDWLIIMGVL